ncbi:MAG: hypothetical protein WC712_05380 [Candidatus Brocadiia bacterium]
MIAARRALTLALALLALASVHTVSAEQARSWSEILKSADAAGARGDKLVAYSEFEKAYVACPQDIDRRDIIRRALLLKAVEGPELSEPEAKLVAYYVNIQKYNFLMGSLGGLSFGAKLILMKRMIEYNPACAAWVEEQKRNYSHTFVENLTPEEKQELEKILNSLTTDKLDDVARGYLAQGNYVFAIKLYWAYLMKNTRLTEEEGNKIRAKILEIVEKAETEVSPEDTAKVETIFAAEILKEWAVKRSMHFIFTAPPGGLDTINSYCILRIDLAYLIVSDLFSNPFLAGRRAPALILPYWAANGSFADILTVGSLAMPGPDNWDITRICNSLSMAAGQSYNPFPTAWSGWEILGDLACKYMLESARKATVLARKMSLDFDRYYVARDIHFYEMQAYDGVAGFLAGIMLKFGTGADGEMQWLKMRAAFSAMKALYTYARPRWQAGNTFGYCLASAFGPGVYEELRRCHFALPARPAEEMTAYFAQMVPRLKEAAALYGAGNYAGYAAAEEKCWAFIRDFPDSEYTYEAYRLLIWACNAMAKNESMTKIQKRVGIIKAWAVVGPFYAANVDFPLAHILPPEKVVNYGQTFPNTNQVAKWGYQNTNPEGMFSLAYSYPTSAYAYSLAYFTSPVEEDGWLYFSSNVAYCAWVNGESAIRCNAAPGAWKYNDDRGRIRIRKGVNKLLVKYFNGSGYIQGGGRIVASDGLPVPDLEMSVACMEDKLEARTVPEAGLPLYSEDKEKGDNWYKHWKVTAGNFVVKQKTVFPMGADGTCQWFRFFPYAQGAGPSNMAWLKDKSVIPGSDRVYSFTQHAPAHQNMLLLLDGDGEDDAQCGVGVGIIPGRVTGKLWFVVMRYETVCYCMPLETVPAATAFNYEIAVRGNFYWLKVNGISVFDGVHVPPSNGKFSSGLAVWAPGIGLRAMQISSVK